MYRALEQSSYTPAVTGVEILTAAGGVTYSDMGQKAEANILSGNPDQMYTAFYNSFSGTMFEHGPTYAQKTPVRLEKTGKLQGTITHSVDFMHTRADSKNEVEIQKSFQASGCTGCGEATYKHEIGKHGKMPYRRHRGSVLLPYNSYSHAGLLGSELMLDKACRTHSYN